MVRFENLKNGVLRSHICQPTYIFILGDDLGVGPEESEKKNFGGPSPGKKKIHKRPSRRKNKFIFNFSSAPPHSDGRMGIIWNTAEWV